MVLKHKQFPLMFYSLVWFFCVAWFWIFVKGDALGYAVLVFWALLPLTAILSSCLIGYNLRCGRWRFPIMFGVLHMLADYATFQMANNLAHAKLNAPEFSLLLPGLLCSAIGLASGTAFSILKHRRSRPS